MLASIAAHTPIAEALSSAGAEIAAESPWPLATLLYSLVPPELVRPFAVFLGLFLLAVYCRRLIGTRIGTGIVCSGVSVLLTLALLLRDLFFSAPISGADPCIGLSLWAMLILCVLSASRALRILGTAVVLLIWPAFDLSWPAAYCLVPIVAIGGLFDENRRAGIDLLAASALGAMTFLLRSQSAQELSAVSAALSSVPESSLRMISGWFTPNFQNRRELLLSLPLVLWVGRICSLRETALILSVFLLTFISEFGAAPLALLAGISSANRFCFDRTRFFCSAYRAFGSTFAMICIATLLSLSRAEPDYSSLAAREVLSALQKPPITLGEQRIFHDYRISPEMLRAGLLPWIDARVLGQAASPAAVAEYDALMRLGEKFQETLELRQIRAVLLPEDAPLINVLRELGGWRERARSSLHPLFFRGIARERSLVLLFRDKP